LDFHGATVSTIGILNVSSATESVTLDLVGVAGPTNLTDAKPLEITGLSVSENKLRLSREFFLALSTTTFPLKGYIRAKDNRTRCILAEGILVMGPCATIVPFSLDVADFNPFCPDDNHRFSPNNELSISWIEPKLMSANGTAIALTRTHSPGDLFKEGETTVAYAAQDGQTLAQPVATRMMCSFKVRFSRCK
jgi:hypothetical protein